MQQAHRRRPVSPTCPYKTRTSQPAWDLNGRWWTGFSTTWGLEPLPRWFYGHFHQTWHLKIEGVRYNMIDIMELREPHCEPQDDLWRHQNWKWSDSWKWQKRREKGAFTPPFTRKNEKNKRKFLLRNKTAHLLSNFAPWLEITWVFESDLWTTVSNI